MATIDKSKSQTYDFLSKNKSIEDILNQPNTTFKEKSRHGGKTFKIIEKNNETNNILVNNELSENEIFYDALDYLNNISKEDKERQSIIQELEKENKQFKNEIEQLKQGNIHFENFKYNSVTIYDEKQKKQELKKLMKKFDQSKIKYFS